MDRNIKNMLMVDVFHLVGFVPVDPRHMEEELAKGKLDRMLARSRGSGTVHVCTSACLRASASVYVCVRACVCACVRVCV